MKALNQLISEYTCHVQRGEIKAAYKGILEFIGKLRADFIKRYPYYDTGSIYQGYMDMSYFSLSTKLLTDKGLKLAVVYLHEKGDFEVWLSGRNREISKEYKSNINRIMSDNITVFHNDNNHDALIECTLISAPNFEEQASLIDIIEQGVETFTTAINSLF